VEKTSTENRIEHPAALIEQHYTAAQIAERWRVSVQTVKRLFQHEPGVLKISLPQKPEDEGKPPHTTLRIPESVYDRVYGEKTGNYAFGQRRRYNRFP
jgi:hypothetical protein